MSPLEKLDTVLKVFYDNPKQWAINKLDEKLLPMKHTELVSILDKLRKDGYIIFISQGIFQISFEGSAFIESGGYVKQNIRDRSLESSAKVNRKFLTWLTFFVALGTMIAAVYYLVELYWNHHWFH